MPDRTARAFQGLSAALIPAQCTVSTPEFGTNSTPQNVSIDADVTIPQLPHQGPVITGPLNGPLHQGGFMCQTSRDAGLHLDTITDFARSWWSDDRFRLLPGEEDDHTVFVIDFYDRCKYFGYTRDLVFYRAASLAVHIAGWPPDTFVMEHARHVPYTIRCIKSGLNDLKARRLRNMLVAQAPQNLLAPRGSCVQTHNCWLLEPNDLRQPATVLETQQR